MKTKASKKLLSTISVLFLMLCVALGVALFNPTKVSSANAAATVSEEPTDLTFLKNADSESYKVRILDKTLTEIRIPSSYNGLPVTAIDDSGFMGCTSLEKIIIPSSIKRIGNNAFMRCTKLKKVLGMSGVESYGNNAFSMCSSLEYLILPRGLTSVGTYMLRNVSATVYSRTSEEDLSQLNSSWATSFSGKVVYGNDLVYEYYKDPLTEEEGLSIVSWQNIDLIPDGYEDGTTLIVESWHSDAEKEGKVLNIAQCAFSDCNAENIIIRHSNGYEHTINIETGAFMQVQASNISIEVDITMNDPYDPNGISGSIFYDSQSLQTITLPDTIDAIPFQMFADCKNLTTINWLGSTETNKLPTSVTTIESEAFYSCYSILELYIPKTIEFIGEYAFYDWGRGTETQTIFINLEQPGATWNPRWDEGINYRSSDNEIKCEVEFIALTELNVQFIVEQEGVINAGGSKSITVSRNDTLNDIDLTDPEADSHTFSGIWYTTESRSVGTEFAWDRQIKTDLTLYAGWTIKTFNITFPQVNGCHFYDFYNGECVDSQVKQFEYGETYTFYITKNEGYYNFNVFRNGGFFNPVAGDVYTLNVTDKIDITVTYDLQEYNITYSNVRKGKNPNAKITSYTVESETITFEAPSWVAYKNSRWNIPQIPKGSTGDRDIRAVWEDPVEYTITFKLDEDPNASNPNGTTKKYTVEDTVRLSDPTSPGFVSGAWKDEYGNIVSGWNADERFEDIELSVLWGIKSTYWVSFDLNGGSGDNAPIQIGYGDVLPTIAIPTWYDYEFKGYYSLNNGQKYYDENMNPVLKWYQTDDDTLIARWERVYFYITYEQRNGTGIGGPTKERVRYGSELPKITMPTRKGYAVSGYRLSDDKGGTYIYNYEGSRLKTSFDYKEDITLYCTWRVVDNFNILIEQKHCWTTESADLIQKLTLPYDGVIEFTADETIHHTNAGTYGFSYWITNIGGEDKWEKDTNEWKTITTERTLKIDVATLIETYFPNYLESYYPEYIHLRAFFWENVPVQTCVAAGTNITLADGGQKKVEDLTGDEELLVWNLFTGQYDVTPILFIDHDPMAFYETISLNFSDGTVVKVMGEHGFWDITLNQYVYLDENANQYIGHWFNKHVFNENGQMTWTKVQLVNVDISTEYTTTWSPVTYGHLCYYVNGMLSMPGGIGGLFNIFNVDGETMRYDEAAMNDDIQTYGLFTYEEFAEVLPVPETIFEAFNGQYLKVALGKGLITWETLHELVVRYEKFFYAE